MSARRAGPFRLKKGISTPWLPLGGMDIIMNTHFPSDEEWGITRRMTGVCKLQHLHPLAQCPRLGRLLLLHKITPSCVFLPPCYTTKRRWYL